MNGGVQFNRSVISDGLGSKYTDSILLEKIGEIICLKFPLSYIIR
jgi:hypothetical protein